MLFKSQEMLTLEVIEQFTKLDIMDRGTDARNLLLGKVIPLRLGYVGVVNRSQEDILLKRNIQDALVAENKFFCNHPVYNGLADCCGIPQLAKKLNQILMQHINAILPSLKSGISSLFVSVEKEHANLGEIKESKDGKGALVLNILSKYCEGFASIVDGKDDEISTSELSGGARVHYIFQSIFVKSLEELDPCEDLTDEDIRTAIRNAAGPRSALFVPEVPFEKLVRRQIARLLDPSLQCVRFIFDELIKISHSCMVTELQRFPFLRKHMDEATGKFLQEGIKPSKKMITRIVEMEMDYINTSHKNFIGGSKAVEIALQQVRSSKVPVPISRPKDGVEADKPPASEGSLKSWIFTKKNNGAVAEQGIKPGADVEKGSSPGFQISVMGGRFTVGLYGNTSASGWGIPSIFGGSNSRTSDKESASSERNSEPLQTFEQSFSSVQLREPPTVLKLSESHSEQVDVEILVIKLLIKSYFDIVRNNIEDLVPKAIMHFLVNRSKRELHNVFIKKLYRENLFEELLQEPEEIRTKRKQTQETLLALQQAIKAFDELPLEAE